MRERDLTPDDIPGCMALSRAAGWNQAPEDWRHVLEAGRARGAVMEGRLVASAALMPYGAFGWICMVLVVPDVRRQGHATRLMDWATRELEAAGRIAGLDATPEGREVYARLRFRDVAGLTRWAAPEGAHGETSPASMRCRAMTDTDFEIVAREDARVFRADRRSVVAAFRERRPDLALVSCGADAIEGYCFGRGGDLATHVGPVVAPSDVVGQALIDAAVARTRGAVIIDLADRHVETAGRLARAGFVARRSFTRMVRSDRPFGMDGAVFAVAGPEFG